MSRILIAFTGLAGSGKSTAALHLVEQYGYARVRFADPLKKMMAALGLTPEQYDGALKETPCDLLCGKTPRRAMQSIGTEWGRALIGPDVWTRAWQHSVRQFDQLPFDQHIVVDDCRFPNEVEAVKEMGGVIVYIARPGAGLEAEAGAHESERHNLLCNLTLLNDASRVSFLQKVEGLHRTLTWACAA
jgi:hypothetical protein